MWKQREWKKIADGEYDLEYYKSRGLFGDRANFKLLHTVDLIESRLPKAPIVADIACGTGTLTRKLAEYFETVYAIDISEAALEECKKRADKSLRIKKVIKYVPTEITKDFRKKIEPLDAAFCINVLEHFKKKEAKRIFRNISNVVKEGGYVYVCIPTKSPLSGSVLKAKRKLGTLPPRPR